MKEEKIDEIEYHVEQIMTILGITRTPSTMDTPSRVARMYVNEVFKHVNNQDIDTLKKQMTTFPLEGSNDEIIIIKDIEFHSMCEHHFMPFSGKIAVGYVPNSRIIGLSKIPRVVKYFSKKPQLQERLCQEIASFIHTSLDCKGIIVYCYDTKHTCVSDRGVEACCDTDTVYSENITGDTRKEFFTRVRG